MNSQIRSKGDKTIPSTRTATGSSHDLELYGTYAIGRGPRQSRIRSRTWQNLRCSRVVLRRISMRVADTWPRAKELYHDVL